MTNIVLLDGGLGQELMRRSPRSMTPLWMAQTLLDEPQLVEQVQSDFVAAGAQVLTLAAYISTPARLARDASPDLFEPLQRAAIAVARKAVAGTNVKIAGCLPPLVASFKAEFAPDEGACRASYDQIVAIQNEAVDLFQCETLATIREVNASVAAAAATGKPVWCSMTIMDADGTKLRSGEMLEEAAKAAIAAGAQAALVNCASPEAIKQALPILKKCGVPFGAYANGFVSVDALQAGGTVSVLEHRKDLGPVAYADIALSWVDQGATIIGGCCEVGPKHIQKLSERLKSAGHTLVGEIS